MTNERQTLQRPIWYSCIVIGLRKRIPFLYVHSSMHFAPELSAFASHLNVCMTSKEPRAEEPLFKRIEAALRKCEFPVRTLPALGNLAYNTHISIQCLKVTPGLNASTSNGLNGMPSQRITHSNRQLELIGNRRSPRPRAWEFHLNRNDRIHRQMLRLISSTVSTMSR